MPRATRSRPFTVFDGMILVAATAAGLWIVRTMEMAGDGMFGGWPSINWPEPNSPFRWGTYRGIHALFCSTAFEAMPLVFPWTLAVLTLRLWRPRPPARRLCRQPGFTACVAVTLTAGVVLLGELSSSIDRATWGDGQKFQLKYLLMSFRDTYLTAETDLPLGFAVAAVWAVMAIGRMVRREPGWLDGLGTAIGSYWVATLILAVSRVQAD